MTGFDNLDILFMVCGFAFQLTLIIYFALRKWRLKTAMRYGPIVYALSIPAAAVSILLITGGKSWSLWVSGFLYLAWAIFGYSVEYIWKIEWRSSLRWSILIPYVFLFLATVMFCWFPLALIKKPLWYVYAVFCLISTIFINTLFNMTSHKARKDSY